MNTAYATKTPLPKLQFISFTTTGKTILKTPFIDLDLTDGSHYYGQADTAKTMAVGFGHYHPKTVKSVINNYMG